MTVEMYQCGMCDKWHPVGKGCQPKRAVPHTTSTDPALSDADLVCACNGREHTEDGPPMPATRQLIPERAKPRITVKRCALPPLMLGMRRMVAYSDEWEREANRLARERTFIHPCDDCGYPQIDFKCNNCGRASW